MNWKRLALSVVVVFTTGCPKVKYVSPVWATNLGCPGYGDPYDVGYTKPHWVCVRYKSEADLNQEEQERASHEMREARNVRFSQAGRLEWYIVRYTIGAADAQSFSAVIFKDGLEVQRKTWSSDIPYYTSGSSAWRNTLWMSPQVEPPFEVYLIDKIHEVRYGYRVSASGAVEPTGLVE